MTPAQIKLVHVAARSLGIEEGEYRLILLNIGGVKSSKDLDQRGLEDVMAHFEERGYVQRRCGHNAPFYWRTIVQNRVAFADSRQCRKIRTLHAQDGTYKLEGLCLRHSRGRADQPEKLKPWEASNLIEALKAIIERNQVAAVGAGAALSDDDIPF